MKSVKLKKTVSPLKYSFWLFICFFLSCKEPVYHFNEGAIFGTTYHIVYKGSKDLDVEIRQELKKVDESLSMFNKSSVISSVNNNQSDRVDQLFIRMFRKAEEVYKETGGAFDITVAPLTNAWGFGYKKGELPTRERIDTLLQWIGMDKLHLSGERIIKDHDSIKMDASAIAKGLGVDVVAEYLEKQKITHYMVEIGGEVRANGLNKRGVAWQIGIDKPIEGASSSERVLNSIMELSGGALATSGNYRNFYKKGETKYGHTIDPHTGYPIQRQVLSASVYAPNCMEADAYATAFMVLGIDESIRIVNKLPQLEAYFIFTDQEGEQRVWMSEGFKKMVLQNNF